MAKRITEKKTFFVTRDTVETDNDVGLFGGSPDQICIWEGDKKPTQDLEGNYDLTGVEADMQDMDCDVAEEIARIFGMEFERGICIKVQLEINRSESAKDVLTAALRSSSIRTKDAAIKSAIAAIKEDE